MRADGGLVHIRPALATDLQALQELHAGASDRSLYLRFFGFGRYATEKYAERLVRPASAEHQALTAWVGGQIAGVAAYERLTDDSAELALLVTDARQHEGIGTLLVEHLAVIARRAGISRFVADVLSSNYPAMRALRNGGFPTQVQFEGGTAVVTIELTPDSLSVGVIGERERSADAASLRRVLAPASVVVVGPSERANSVGHQILKNILSGGYSGEVFGVHPRNESVLGVPCVASARLLPKAPDLAVIAVPLDQVLDVVRDCGERGVHGAVVITAGFGETGEEGQARQDAIVDIARGSGMRLVGPNCLGLLNTDPAVQLNATFTPLPMQPGGLGLVSQSGALGVAVLNAAARWGLGVSQFVSVGNKTDVSSNDLLLAWEHDERTRVIAMYLESFGNPRRLSRIARRIARHKPIIAIKAGRSAAGQLAGLSHTASAAASDDVVDALFAQAGVLRVNTMDQMLDAARVLCDQPLPHGNRVAVVGNSGGTGILAADAADGVGLTVQTLTPATEARLRQLTPMAPSCRNPVDLGAEADPTQIGDALRVLLAAPEIDAVLAVFSDTAVADADWAMKQIAETANAADKPVVAARVGAEPSSIAAGGSARALPVFTFPEPAAAALAAAVRYAAIRSARTPAIVRPAGIDQIGALEIVNRAVSMGASWLAADEVALLLSCYGIPVSAQRVVADVDAAVRAAAQLGYPLAVSIAAGERHPKYLGMARLTVTDEVSLRRVFADVSAMLRDTSEPPDTSDVLLQPMPPPGMEMIIGAVQHDRFGPAVMVGAGGILADFIADRTFRLTPLTVEDADDMLSELRTAPVLDGYLRTPAGSRATLCDLVVRIGALADDLPQVAELELDPVICARENVVVVDARIRVAAADPRPDPLLRQLTL